jgi:hypothetical protein
MLGLAFEGVHLVATVVTSQMGLFTFCAGRVKAINSQYAAHTARANNSHVEAIDAMLPPYHTLTLSSIPLVAHEAHEPRTEATLQRTRYAPLKSCYRHLTHSHRCLRSHRNLQRNLSHVSPQHNIPQVSYNHYHNAQRNTNRALQFRSAR